MSGSKFLRYNFKVRILFTIVALFEDYLSDGVFGGVREGKVRGVCAGAREEFVREIVKSDGRRARRIGDDFDVLPREAAAPTRAERFQRGFFRGEARGVVLRRDDATPLAVVAFALSKNAFDETRRAAQDCAHARHFNYVYAD